MMTSSSVEFTAGIAPRPSNACRLSEQSLYVAPANDVHEGIDIACRLGAEVHVIGVLVHIERENRRATRQGMAMVRRPLVDKLAVARRPRQQNPPEATAERFTHGEQLAPPT